MEKNLTDFLGKYFNKVFYLPKLEKEKTQGVCFEAIESGLNMLNLKDDDLKKVTDEISSEARAITNFAIENLNTIRKLKTFRKVFKSRITRLRRDIYVPDVIIMAIIESSNMELFNKINNNRIFFAADYKHRDQFEMVLGFTKGFFFREKNSLSDFVSKQINTDEREVVFYLFKHVSYFFNLNIETSSDENMRFEINQFLEENETKQRLAHPFLIDRYFQELSPESAIGIITNKDYKSDILDACAKKNVSVSEIANMLVRLFPEGSSNSELRKLSLAWLRRVVEDEDLNIAYRVVLALSITAKKNLSEKFEFLGLSEKKSASFLTWHYLSRNASDQRILIEIQKLDDCSDTFATTAVFYALHEDRTPDRTKVAESIKEEMVVEFLKRVERKINSGKSIFTNTEISDDPLQILWRWFDSIDYLNKIGKAHLSKPRIDEYLVRILTSNAKDFDVFISEFVGKDFRDDHPMLNADLLSKMLGQDQLRTIFENHLHEGTEKDIAPRNLTALLNWYHAKSDL